MTPVLSVYIDLIRFIAAIVVAMNHIWPMAFPGHPLPWPGHDAVVVFFVLSGLVIAHSTDRNGRTLAIYAQNRIARIVSVAWPALLLVALIAPHVPTDVPIYDAPVVGDAQDFWQRIALNAVFLAQSWSLDQSPPIDSPFWSLNFEVWYYVIFGVWTYTAGYGRLAATLLTILVAGPKILLLMPVWILGVIICRYRPRLSERAALLLMAVTVVLGLAFFWFGVSIAIRMKMSAQWPDFMASLHGANQFVGDTLLGLIVAANFVAAANLSRLLQPLMMRERLIKLLASFTFSAYLYHMPLFALLYGIVGLRAPALLLPLLVLSITAMGLLTERRASTVRAWLGRLALGSIAERKTIQAAP